MPSSTVAFQSISKTVLLKSVMPTFSLWKNGITMGFSDQSNEDPQEGVQCLEDNQRVSFALPTATDSKTVQFTESVTVIRCHCDHQLEWAPAQQHVQDVFLNRATHKTCVATVKDLVRENTLKAFQSTEKETEASIQQIIQPCCVEGRVPQWLLDSAFDQNCIGEQHKVKGVRPCRAMVPCVAVPLWRIASTALTAVTVPQHPLDCVLHLKLSW